MHATEIFAWVFTKNPKAMIMFIHKIPSRILSVVSVRKQLNEMYFLQNILLINYLPAN